MIPAGSRWSSQRIRWHGSGCPQPLGSSIDLAPRSILVIFPMLDRGESFPRERLEPMISMMPASKILLPM